MDVKRLVVGRVSTNCYFLENDKKCVIVDPGGDFEKIVSFINAHEYEPVAIFLKLDCFI